MTSSKKHDVGDSYDAVVDLYAEINLDSLIHDTNARGWLAAFADLASAQSGAVLDLGCGPGHVVDHLSKLDLRVVGYDISPGQIAKAQATFPDEEFHVGDLAALDVAAGSIGGVLSRYSIIHLDPSLLGAVFSEWLRILEPGAPALVSFFGATSSDGHATPFDHKVATAYALFPATIAELMRKAGFGEIETAVAPPIPDGGRPYDQATILGRKPLGLASAT